MDLYVIDCSLLKKGDIILERRNNRKDSLIEKQTGFKYTHAMLYVGGTLIEAEGLGVQSSNPQRHIYDYEDDFVVLRPSNATKKQIESACMYARSLVGTEFSNLAARASLQGKVLEPHKQYCSRLVAEAYESANYKIVSSPSSCKPSDIFESSSLKKITNLWRVATDEDLGIVDSKGIMSSSESEINAETNYQADNTGDLLKQIRECVNDDKVQSLSDIIEYIIENQHFDDRIATIIENSDYFVQWERYKKEKPEEFDCNLFIQKYGDKSVYAAHSLLYSMNEPLRIWEINLNIYDKLYNSYQLETFRVFKELYEHLIEWANERESVLMNVLFNYSNK